MTPLIRLAAGLITSTFGYRLSSFPNRREFHQGLDIAAPKGTPVIAPADGIISFVGIKGLLGRIVVIDHGNGIITRYGHLYKALKKNGNHVKRGEIIARIGTSGRSTEYHLYYEVHVNGIPVNPEKYIRYATNPKFEIKQAKLLMDSNKSLIYNSFVRENY